MGGNEMKDNLKELHTLRIATEMWKSTVEVAQNILEETSQYQRLQRAKESLSKCEAEANELADSIRHNAEVEFVMNHLENTKPYDGIQIKKFNVVHLLDERQAITWAATNAPQVLSLKKAPFNKIAKVLDLDFVKINDEYRAQIASDLSMYEDTKDD